MGRVRPLAQQLAQSGTWSKRHHHQGEKTMENADAMAAGYFAATTVIDWQHPAVQAQAAQLARAAEDKLALARRCYAFVRDAIDHSFDVDATAVTCSASEVLLSGHGICYAKSHLLAALLRANGIGAGFGYQRLQDDEGGFCLHGYNWVALPQYGWYPIDARGNRGGVDARFCPPQVRLAFPTQAAGECDYGINLAQPLGAVVRTLQGSANTRLLAQRLPSSIPMG
jgi:transglutaminase-like putative cysteine protease